MVSYSGYWTYQNIIQAEPVPNKEVCQIKSNTISGYLKQHPDYQLFSWMIKKADMDLKMGNEQFDATLFVVNDDNLRQQFGSDDFFLRMDKNKAYNILYAHLLNRKISKHTLMSQRLTKIYTKNEKTEIMFLNNYGDVTLNNMSRLVKENIKLQNGIIHEIDRLLLPVF
jgi:uncharacterized surface protein with fasciclin (FAS1) repeats